MKKEPFRLGIVPADAYRERRKAPGYDWVKSIIVCVFPYRQAKAQGRYLPARFGYGSDYHAVLSAKLEEVARTRGLSRYEILVDRSAFDEKLLAWLAGLGFLGRNTLLITPEFGSYVVIGTILTDHVFPEYSRPLEASCGECDLCVKKCPSSALAGGFNRESCLSFLTQVASEDFPRYDLLKDAYYGCDICQEVCPHNRGKDEYLREFEFSDDSVLTLAEMESLNRKTFQEKFKNKNFAWIGYLKMLRNIIVLEANNNNINIEKIEYFQKLHASAPWFYRHMEYLKKRLKNGAQ